MSGGVRIGRPGSGGSVPMGAVTPGQVAKALSLAMQSVLDQALKLADADTRTRFAALLGSDADRSCDTGMSTAGRVAGGSVVTRLRRPERARSVS